MTDLHFRSASDLSRMIRRREIGSAELTDHFIAWIEKHDPKINAVVARDFDGARKAAKAADAALARGELQGPLHGLPFTIKDAYEVAGLTSTGGNPVWKDHVPARSATAIERLQRAGAIVFGKTNVPYLSGDLQSFNEIYGTTNNPYALDCGPGGSSGGSAAALAAGFTAAEFGSDIGGSIRTPAHLCGVFGHKPSYGIVPKRGHLGPAPGNLHESDLSVAGPLARSAEDLGLLLDIAAGPGWADAAGWKLDLPPARAARPRDLRVAVWIEDSFCDIDRESAALLTDAARALEAAGAHLDWQARPDFTLAEITETYLVLLHSQTGAGMPDSVRARWAEIRRNAAPDDRSHQVLQAIGGTMNVAEQLVWKERQAQLRRKWQDFFKSYDVVLAPVLMRPAFEHDHQSNWHKRVLDVNGIQRHYMDVLIWAGPAVVSYLPASVAPVGLTSEGKPVGIQIIGPHLEDRTTIAVAGMFEEILGGFKPPKGW
ncbi:amidase [uncultured Parvibaculum sp.]|uniref:amidase n=1 Tax=uncultured Parvibaculum sp. TaxID=291828 RepID=UPI0030D82A0A|tara:strand:- start:29118 stop:30575 length:1458 start_codon:yes stop_codon:yes gene_type:complete